MVFRRSFGTFMPHLSFHTSESGRLIYLSIPPKFFASVAKNINDIMRPLRKTAWLRVVFEKPFGRDISSAKKLAKELAAELKVILFKQLTCPPPLTSPLTRRKKKFSVWTTIWARRACRPLPISEPSTRCMNGSRCPRVCSCNHISCHLFERIDC